MKDEIATLNLGKNILSRLDAIAAAERRSRSNQARIFLETAMNADEALRQQAENHFQSLQMPGRFDTRSAAGGPRSFAFSSEEHRAGERLVNAQPSYGAADAGDFPPPAAPSNSLPKEHKMTVPDPHAQLKADAVRTAAAGIASRLYPKKDNAK